MEATTLSAGFSPTVGNKVFASEENSDSPNEGHSLALAQDAELIELPLTAAHILHHSYSVYQQGDWEVQKKVAQGY